MNTLLHIHDLRIPVIFTFLCGETTACGEIIVGLFAARDVQNWKISVDQREACDVCREYAERGEP